MPTLRHNVAGPSLPLCSPVRKNSPALTATRLPCRGKGRNEARSDQQNGELFTMTPQPTTLTVPERKALRRSMVAIGLLGALGLFLGQANPFLQCPPLTVLYPACLALLASLAPTGKYAWRAGWFSGTIGNSLCLYWVAVPLHDFGMLPWILTAPCVVALGAYLGLYSAFFALGMRLFRKHLPFPLPLVLAFFLWTALEHVKAWAFTGFPWICLATAFVPWPVWTQAASLTGSFVLSGLFALVGVAMTEAAPLRVGFGAVAPWRRRFTALGFAVLPLALIYTYGLFALASPLPEGRRITVAIAQGNVDQNQKWAPEYQQGTLTRYLSLSEAAADPALGKVRKPVDIILWPETAMPFYPEASTRLTKQIVAFAEQRGVPVAFGAPGKPAEPDGGGYYNRMWLYTPSAPVPSGTRYSVAETDSFPGKFSYYDKNHLVPFGEYVPLNIPFPFIKRLLQGVDFRPGNSGNPLLVGDIALGGLICYEAIFPELARERALNGANILVNISNDAWFGRTAAPVQHLYLTAMRAIETGRYVVRSTNTGISAIIDPRGRITAQSRLFRAQTLMGEARLQTRTTVYCRIAPFLPWGCVLTVVAAAGFCLMRKRRATQRFQQ